MYGLYVLNQGGACWLLVTVSDDVDELNDLGKRMDGLTSIRMEWSRLPHVIRV